jgi:collagenase-like PrtC family protease
MKTIILNIEDSIFDEIINSLKSYPKKKLQIINANPTQDDLTEFSEDLRKAFIEIKQIKEGKKQARTWWDARNEL